MKNILMKSTFLILMMVSRGIQSAEGGSSDSLSNKELTQLIRQLAAAKVEDQNRIQRLENTNIEHEKTIQRLLTVTAKHEKTIKELKDGMDALDKRVDRVVYKIEDNEEIAGITAKPRTPDWFNEGINEGIECLTKPFIPWPFQRYFSVK